MPLVSAVYIEDNGTIINMDHATRIKEINVVPENIAPGNPAEIRIKIENNAYFRLDDVRIKLVLPSEFKFLNDVNQVKISRLESKESKDFAFNIIAAPATAEGIYQLSLIADYVSYLGKEYYAVGEDKEDNYTFGVVVKASPEIFAQIEKSEIYKGNDIGLITIKIVNKGIGNAKFVVLELLNSEDYEIISANREYIGDLDSDDFDSVDFRIKLNKEKNTDLLLKIDYKDSLNQQYLMEFSVPLEIRTAKELGIATNGTTTIIVIIIIIAVIGYFVYKKFRKKKWQELPDSRTIKFKNHKI